MAQRSLSVLLLGLSLTACEGELGIRDARGGPAPTLRGTDAGVPRDAAFPPSAPDAPTPPPPMVDAATAPSPPPPPTGCGTPTEQAVLGLANQARAASGARALVCDELMTTVARAHSQDMCDRGYFSHTSRDGRSPFDRMRDAGVRFGTAGENIAQGQRSADEVHNAWMNSAGHRMNILNGAYRRLGVGLAECGGRMYWTQVFAD
jgi:uncharacterized protein YkwD